jgi:hypothetical protein
MTGGAGSQSGSKIEHSASSSMPRTSGREWYVMRDAKILEVRAYCILNTEHSVELATFPYAARGYRPTPREVAATAAPI